MKTLKKLFITITLMGSILIVTLFGLGYFTYEKAREKLPVEEVREHLVDAIPNYVETNEISDAMKVAMVAVEDHRFYDRYGIDFIALSRALIKNIVTLSFKEGGSTITQQLAKNVYFDYHTSVTRKMAEYYFIYDFEDLYTKDEILEMYLNVIYYGDGYYGVYDASIGYFGKEPSKLTLFEASLLTGIVNAPSAYRLSTGLELALNRQRHVIDRMYETGKITADVREELLKMQETYPF